MEHKMYLYEFSNHTEIVTDALSNKREQLKNRVNRADNFVNLTLLGVEKCLKNTSLETNTNLYIASENGNMNSTIKILEAIFKQNRLPMPFNFLNSVNASILFFVAKSFNIEGKGIFVAKFESALVQAYVDVSRGDTVLIGLVNEVLADLEQHKKKFLLDIVEEESRWLLLANEIKDKNPIAKISNFKIIQNNINSKNTINNLFYFLENEKKNFSFQSKNLSFIISKC